MLARFIDFIPLGKGRRKKQRVLVKVRSPKILRSLHNAPKPSLDKEYFEAQREECHRIISHWSVLPLEIIDPAATRRGIVTGAGKVQHGATSPGNWTFRESRTLCSLSR